MGVTAPAEGSEVGVTAVSSGGAYESGTALLLPSDDDRERAEAHASIEATDELRVAVGELRRGPAFDGDAGISGAEVQARERDGAADGWAV
ncbi:MAG: hypothetical protein ACOZQL_40495 [Myxococcota bacterium]